MSIFNALLDMLDRKGNSPSIGQDCDISDSDVPAGSGGINREGYTYAQLRRQPIIPEVIRGISNPVVRCWAE